MAEDKEEDREGMEAGADESREAARWKPARVMDRVLGTAGEGEEEAEADEDVEESVGEEEEPESSEPFFVFVAKVAAGLLPLDLSSQFTGWQTAKCLPTSGARRVAERSMMADGRSAPRIGHDIHTKRGE